LNVLNVPAYESIAATGEGIYESFQGIAALLYNQLVERLEKSGEAPTLADVEPGAAGSTSAAAPKAANAIKPATPAQAAPAQATPAPATPAPATPVPTATAPTGKPGKTPTSAPPSRKAPAPRPVDATAPTGADTAQVHVKDDTASKPGKSGDEVSSAVDEALREVSNALEPLTEAANADASEDDSSLQFESMDMPHAADESHSVGRVIDFDDVSSKSEKEREEEDTFITDPFRSEKETRDDKRHTGKHTGEHTGDRRQQDDARPGRDQGHGRCAGR
jgi:hypothetical protein